MKEFENLKMCKFENLQLILLGFMRLFVYQVYSVYKVYGIQVTFINLINFYKPYKLNHFLLTTNNQQPTTSN